MITELVGEGEKVFVHGSPGSGKTFLGKNVCDRLKAKGIFAVCIDVVKALKAEVNSNQSLVKYLVKEHELKTEEVDEFMQKIFQLRGIPFVFDNIDVSATQENAYLKQLLSGHRTEKCGLLWLARQPNPEIIFTASQHIEIGGFDSFGTVLQFMVHQLTTVHKTSRSQQLQLYMRNHPILQELCMIPRMAVILAGVYAVDNKCIKDTETLLIHRMLLEWVRLATAMQVKDVNSLYKLRAEEKKHLLHIAQIAFQGLTYSTSEKEYFSLVASEISHVNLQEGYASLDDVKKFDLVQCEGNMVRNFLHPIVQQFLAAFYLSCRPQSEQIAFYYDHFPKNISQFMTVCLFHFGLTRLETEEFLNPSRIIISGMIESLGHVTLKQEGLLYLELQKLIQACLYEAQDAILVRNFSQQYTKLMNFTFPEVRALDDTRLTTQLVYVILQSGINLWEIEIPNENTRGKTDAIVFPISMKETAIKIAVTVKPNPAMSATLRAVFQERPSKRTGRATEMIKRATNDEEKEMYFQHAMMCTGQRETLHRVTQLYSPVPVKSDAADPAYASLITCECVQQRLREEVVFEPIHPIHTVQLSSKSRKAKVADGERDATARKHIERTHQNNYMEIIVLNKPSVRSITFQPPGGVQQCRLVMSGERTSSPMSGRIAMEAEKSLANQDNCVECVVVQETGGNATRMVCHGLPLPKSKTKIEADKANILQTEETAGTRVKNRSNEDNDADNLRVPATAAQVAPSHRQFQDDDFGLYSPVAVQAESSEKITWRPGMIMFTVSLILGLLFIVSVAAEQALASM